MEWCGTLYWEYGITERLARAGRTLIVLLMLAMITATGYGAGQGSFRMSAEVAGSMTAESAAVESTAAVSITSEAAVNAAEYFTHTPPALSVSEATEHALLMDGGEVLMMSPELPSVWPEEKTELTVPEVPEAVIPAVSDRLETAVPSVPTEPETAVPSVPLEPETALPSAPTEPETALPSVPLEPETALPSIPTEPEMVIPSVPEESEAVIPSVPEEPEVIIPSVPTEPEEIIPPSADSSGDPEVSAPLETAGFLVDESGIIYGVTDALAVADGCLVLPSEGCTGIAFGAFANAPGGIYEVYIPSNITYIAEGAFTGLVELEWFETAASGTYYTVDGVLFSEGGTCLLSFPSGRIGSYKVPAGVSRFAYGAFDSANIDTVDATDCILTDVGNLPATIVLLQR